MSGSPGTEEAAGRPGQATQGSAEQHLGESLAALVDGELGDDSRERVLAHLATCAACRAEAEAQRRLKRVFADSALPPPSEGLLARLQGLPGGGQGPVGPRPVSGGPVGGDGGASPLNPPGRAASPLDPPRLGPERGFRIHDTGTAARGMLGHRFAFAAAGAFSLAAFAIGGALTTASVGPSPSAGGAASPTVAAGGGLPSSAAPRAGGRGDSDGVGQPQLAGLEVLREGERTRRDARAEQPAVVAAGAAAFGTELPSLLGLGDDTEPAAAAKQAEFGPVPASSCACSDSGSPTPTVGVTGAHDAVSPR